MTAPPALQAGPADAGLTGFAARASDGPRPGIVAPAVFRIARSRAAMFHRRLAACGGHDEVVGGGRGRGVVAEIDRGPIRRELFDGDAVELFLVVFRAGVVGGAENHRAGNRQREPAGDQRGQGRGRRSAVRSRGGRGVGRLRFG